MWNKNTREALVNEDEIKLVSWDKKCGYKGRSRAEKSMEGILYSVAVIGLIVLGFIMGKYSEDEKTLRMYITITDDGNSVSWSVRSNKNDVKGDYSIDIKDGKVLVASKKMVEKEGQNIGGANLDDLVKGLFTSFGNVIEEVLPKEVRDEIKQECKEFVKETKRERRRAIEAALEGATNEESKIEEVPDDLPSNNN